jgi:quercetin dioxygenase-like cupin family protein
MSEVPFSFAAARPAIALINTPSPHEETTMSRRFSPARCRRVLFFLLPAVAMAALAFAAGVWAGQRGDSAAPALVVERFDRTVAEKTPFGSLRWLMSGKIDPRSNITLGIAELEPGKSNPVHVHDNCEEVIYILSGSCEQRVGQETVLMKTGDTLHIPAGVPHTARALGREPMRSIVAYNSGDRHFKAVAGK